VVAGVLVINVIVANALMSKIVVVAVLAIAISELRRKIREERIQKKDGGVIGVSKSYLLAMTADGVANQGRVSSSSRMFWQE